tara:strand:- start:1009 stop:2337 length:1329 start_codon:yes stop_codon:yes gene_type:complete
MDLLTPISVSELNKQARTLLEDNIGHALIIGEISNLITASSGHRYFSLKDDYAQISCVQFKHNQNSAIPIQNGDQIQAFVKISLYEPRGTFQCLVLDVNPEGFGNKQAELEALKQKLLKEGLFDSKHKINLPRFPQSVGVITSPHGAAIHDFIKTLSLRMPMIEIIIFPVLVQGDKAAESIRQGLAAANQSHCDVLVITRGGGSVEDLWPFNDEQLARDIFSTTKPIVSAVGHEVDTTLADLVADVRAATPTAAAQVVSQDQNTLMEQIDHINLQLKQLMDIKINRLNDTVFQMSKRLLTPEQMLLRLRAQVKQTEMQLRAALNMRIKQGQDQLHTLQIKLTKLKPHFERQQNDVIRKATQLKWLMEKKIVTCQQNMGSSIKQLEILSPLKTLHRGYAIVTSENQTSLKSIADVTINDQINLRLKDGAITAKVLSKKKRSAT